MNKNSDMFLPKFQLFDEIQCMKKPLEVFTTTSFYNQTWISDSRQEILDRSNFFFIKLNQARPEIYNSSASGTRAATRETRVARFANNNKIL